MSGEMVSRVASVGVAGARDRSLRLRASSDMGGETALSQSLDEEFSGTPLPDFATKREFYERLASRVAMKPGCR